MITADDTGADSASGTQCPPWIFPCDDGHDYYTKLVGRCPAPDFREAEFVASRLGFLIGAPVPHAEVVHVPQAIIDATGLGLAEQRTIGLRRLNVDPESQATHAALVAAQADIDLLAIVALHTWLEIGDHSPGHNFFRNLDSGALVTMDHCSGLRPHLDRHPATPVTLLDLGDLVGAVASDSPARTEMRQRIVSVDQLKLREIVDEFPVGSITPWLDQTGSGELVDWLLNRRDPVAHLICP